MIRPRPATAVVLAALAVLAACNKSDKSSRPAELVPITSTAKIDRVWSASVGSGAPKLRLGLGIATWGEAVFAASYEGQVVALRRDTGKRIWSTQTKLRLTGGPGAGEGLVVAGASHGDIVALDAATGELRWKTRINSEILTTPAVGGGFVLVRAGDGRVVALRVADGSEAWSAEQQVPRLSLRGNSRPAVAGNLAIAGFDNGRVLALQLSDGATVWDAAVSPPAGRTELERLNDLDAAVIIEGRELFAVTYQGRAVRMSLETGGVLWARDVSSYSGFGLDGDGVYVSTADGTLVKLARASGTEQWKNESLANRRLSAPAVLGDLVAVGDLEGYLHFFDRGTGEPAARLHALGARVSAPPVVADGLLIAIDTEGHVVALRAAAAPARN